jgi:hypothetical protein
MPEATRRPYIAVVGLEKGQTRIVDDRLWQIARLTFIETSRSDTRIVASVDFIVLTRCCTFRDFLHVVR